MVSLSDIEIGQKAEVKDFEDLVAKCHFAKFGIGEGQVIKCIAKAGAIVIRKNHQEIAVGKNLSSQIYIEAL